MQLFIKAKEEARETRRQFFGQALELLAAAFALIAALAWNDAVRSLIDQYFPHGTGVYSRFMYAIGVTLLAVLVTTRLKKISSNDQEKSQTNEPR